MSPGDVVHRLVDTALLHFRTFWKLREHFRTEGLPLFQVTAKAHQNVHAALMSESLSPRRAWCYSNEDPSPTCLLHLNLSMIPHTATEIVCISELLNYSHKNLKHIDVSCMLYVHVCVQYGCRDDGLYGPHENTS